jgi:hypothetical protein
MRIHKHLPKLATLGALLVLTACASDNVLSAPAVQDDLAVPALPNVVAQQAIIAQEVDAPMFSGHGTMAAVSYPSNAVTYQFTYASEKSQSFIIGAHMVSFPANTVCDPALSTYGPGTWNSPCTFTKKSYTITATTWTDAQGRPQIDFANALRFVPNKDGKLPAIYLRDANAVLSSWARVDYCSFTSSCVNEAATDAALATQRDPVTGYLFRLIRHFSGYNVWA